MDDLTPAKQNPWYVLATLYGEQDEEEIDQELDERNRRAWNAWACQNMTAEERAEVAKTCHIDLAETEGWADIAKEVARMHEKEMLRRNGGGFEYPGLPDVGDAINCSKTRFPNTVVLGKRVFASAASFSSAKFSARAFFSSATFSSVASFHSATFSADTSFYSATFSAVALFHSATFSAAASFTSATFSAGASFHSATFSANALFNSATFSADASFRSATFSADTFFSSATFSADALFFSAMFDGPVFFVKAEFGTRERKIPASVDFAGAQFARPTSFRLAKFQQNFPDLSGAILHDTTTFTALEGLWPEQIDLPEGDGARQSALEAARESAATIRHVVGKQGLPEDEHFFFRKEMGFARQIGPLWQRLPYIGFGALSDYGYSIARPLWWLACLFAYPLGFYGGYLAKDGAAIPAQITGALGLAFSSTFNFLGFQRTYFREALSQFDPLMSFLSGSQTVFGYILLFFLALGLRQRFRLR